MHVHVTSADGEAKFWIEPNVEVATSRGLSYKQLRRVEDVIKDHLDEIRTAWSMHFEG